MRRGPRMRATGPITCTPNFFSASVRSANAAAGVAAVSLSSHTASKTLPREVPRCRLVRGFRHNNMAVRAGGVAGKFHLI
jgi:hypothetical protein